MPAASALPRLDAIDQPSIGMHLQVLAQPVQIYTPRIVAAARLLLDVAGFAEHPQQSTHRRLADTKQRGGLGVRSAALSPIRLYDSSTKIQR